MSATRTLNLAGGCLLGSILLVGCGGSGMDPASGAPPADSRQLSAAIDFCDGPFGPGSWIEGADFCDDFRDGTAARWEPQGGTWEVIDGEYVGVGPLDVCGTGFSSNETLIRDLRVDDVEMRFDMRAQQVDKGIVLRSTGPGDQIELNFRADPYNDLVVQELVACQFIWLDFTPLVPHSVDEALDVRVKLVGDRLIVWINGDLVLDRSFPFQAKSGSVGLAVIGVGGTTEFDNVQVLKNATCL
ncbi:MAG TPA: family 16 glycoside hydrolase [Steroidobacteraceae bacterium]